MKRIFWTAIVLMSAAQASMAQDWWEENSAEYAPIVLEVNAWMNKIDGSVTWGDGAKPGSEINFKEDAGIDSETWGPYVRLNVGLSDRWSFRFGFWHIKHEGDVKLAKPESFGGINFPSGLQTQTTFELNSYMAALGYKFVDGEQLDFHFLFGGGAFATRMDMENSAGALAEREATIPTPLIGAALDLSLTKGLMFRSQIMGFAMGSGSGDGEWYDAEAALNLTLFQGMYITGGYKFFRTNVDFNGADDHDGTNSSNANSADFDVKGPFIGLGLVF